MKVLVSLFFIIQAVMIPKFPPPPQPQTLAYYELSRIYVPGLFDYKVEQQPKLPTGLYDDSYVGEEATQFMTPAMYKTMAILSHTPGPGLVYNELKTGDIINATTVDNRQLTFKVSEIKDYKPVNPTSNESDFVTPKGDTVKVEQVFSEIYKNPGKLVLQTCFDVDGNPIGGRRFIVAQPVTIPKERQTPAPPPPRIQKARAM